MFMFVACCVVSATTIAAPVSETAARARAPAFLKSMGTADAAGAVLGPMPDRQGRYWRDRLAFATADDGRVEIDATTGAISYFYDQGLTRRALGAKRPAGTPISREAALVRARMALRAAGGLAEVGDPVAVLHQLDEPPSAAGQTWTIVWRRTLHGVPYRNQQATVILLAETGQVIGVSLAYATPPAERTTFLVTKRRAIEVAAATIIRHGTEGAEPSRVFKELVLPNRRWVDDTLRPVGAQTDAPVPAWHVELRAGDQIHEVWVDAADGSVLGGESSSIGKTGSRPAIRRR